MKRLFKLSGIQGLLLSCLLLPSLYVPGVSQAQDVGLAFFSLLSPHFPCQVAMQGFSKAPRPALAILWGTFGKDTSCLQEWFRLAAGRPHLLEIHLSNEPCRRNKRCAAEDFLPNLTVNQLNKRLERKDPEIIAAYRARIAAITKTLAPIATSRGEYILSTGLEDNFTDDAYLTVLQLVRELWPYKVVRSAVGQPAKKSRFTADYNEGHGLSPSFSKDEPCIANLDGDDIVFPHRPAGTSRIVPWEQVAPYLQKHSALCRVTFLWSGPWQGLTSDTFIDPMKRSFSVSDQDMRVVSELLK